jgi:hypothetical protein
VSLTQSYTLLMTMGNKLKYNYLKMKLITKKKNTTKKRTVRKKEKKIRILNNKIIKRVNNNNTKITQTREMKLQWYRKSCSDKIMTIFLIQCEVKI